MTTGYTEHSRYSRAAIALHWVIALAIIGQFIGIEYGESLAKGDPALGTVYMLHKSAGLTILVLTVIRLAMRLRRGFLPLPLHMAGWEVLLARTTHVGFYLLMLLMPLSGWIFAVSAERGLNWFGLFAIPPLPLASVKDLAHEFHELGAWALIALFVLHILGALKHHFLDRDDIAARMIPFLTKRG